MATLLKDLLIKEVSSVDRGAGEGVKIMLMKRDDGAAVIPAPDPLSKGGKTMPGLTDDEKTAILAKAEAAKAAGKKPPFLQDDPDDEEAEKAKMSKALADGARALAKLAPEHRAYLDAANLGDAAFAKFIGGTDAERAAQIVAQPLVKAVVDPAIQKRLDEAATDRLELRKLMDERDASAFEKRAIALGLPGVAGDVLRKAYQGDAKAISELERTIKSLTAQAEAGALFKEFGVGGGKAATAKDELLSKRDDLRKATPSLSEAQAFEKVYLDPANVDLKKRYDAEEWSGRKTA